MRDKEATEGCDPILDSRGLLKDVQQLRHVAHELSVALHTVLQTDPMLPLMLGIEHYASLMQMCATAHDAVCDADKPEIQPEEDPTWRLFHPVDDTSSPTPSEN